MAFAPFIYILLNLSHVFRVYFQLNKNVEKCKEIHKGLELNMLNFFKRFVNNR